MHLSGPDLLLSATDLGRYAACPQRTWLDRLKALGQLAPDHRTDPRLELLRERGVEHERRLLAALEAEGKRIVRFEPLAKEERNREGYARSAAATLDAMRDGPDVIYQATLFDGKWLGLADFLIRVERPSDLGSWSYEVADAKLAREAKAGAVLQTCAYSEMLARVQCVEPERIHLYLGGPTPRRVSYRLAHFAAYHRSLKKRLDAHLEAAPEGPEGLPFAPEPVEHCLVCDWRSRCERERLEADHLSLVAGITRGHRRLLAAAGVCTLEALARLPLAPPPEGVRSASFQRVREQARVQLEGRERGRPHHEILPLEDNPGGPPLGLAALPAPHEADWFFDLEGADYAYDEGLEYLWGVSDARDDYRAEWALTQDEEKAALERFLSGAEAHVTAHPGAHVYHFAHYEPTALKRLVGRYGVGTDTLDRLLEKQVFVDLHRIVKQGVRASVESYSLKVLEAHYGFCRDVPLAEANPARARLEYTLAAGLRDDDSLSDHPIVERYNRDDCVSTRALRDWLEGLRSELETRDGVQVPRPAPPEPKEKKDEDVAGEVADLVRRLLDGVPEEPGARTPEQHVRWLTAHLLEWHRREDKSAWWDYFRLRDLSAEELVEETKPLAGLEYERELGPEKKSILYRFRFPEQMHRLESGDKAIDPHHPDESKAVRRQIFEIDELAGTVDLKVGKSTEWNPHALRALIPDDVVRTDDQRAQLQKTAHRLLDGPEALAAWSPASLALLRREAPEFGAEVGDDSVPLTAVAPREGLLERAVRATLGLRDGVLPVQGPPGTGKTYSGARMIRALLRTGLRVGVTGPSHKVITNLLDAVCKADGNDEATAVHGLQMKKKAEEGCTDPRFTLLDGSSGVAKAEAGRAKDGEPPFNLLAGTAWLLSREDMERSVDVLFIDEAGQFSLANALAVAPASPRLVLLGDPQQLNQPQKGIHPPRTEVSVLEHLAGEDGILTEEQGLFLGETWRMRPEITRFTSELFYESKLESRPDLAGQHVTLADGSTPHGLVLELVEHEANARESAEEAEKIVALFRRYLTGGATFTDREGTSRALGLDDLLVVAPYNAQVDRIRGALRDAGFDGARVGTVDKFQGQEAAIAIYSLTSSSAEDAPRGMEFLYALDRLNVATSRARVVTVVVASPGLFLAECRLPHHMRLVNGVVRYGEMAG